MSSRCMNSKIEKVDGFGSSLCLVGASAVFSLVGAKPNEGCRFPATVIALAFLTDLCRVLADERPFP